MTQTSETSLTHYSLSRLMCPTYLFTCPGYRLLHLSTFFIEVYHPHLLTAFNSELTELLEGFSCRIEMVIVNCIIKSAVYEPDLITHLFQAETVNFPSSALSPQNISTLALSFAWAKQ